MTRTDSWTTSAVLAGGVLCIGGEEKTGEGSVGVVSVVPGEETTLCRAVTGTIVLTGNIVRDIWYYVSYIVSRPGSVSYIAGGTSATHNKQ